MKWAVAFFLLAPGFSAFSAENQTLPSDSAFLEKAKDILGDRFHYVQQRVNRLGSKTIELEAYLSAQADLELGKDIFSDYGGLAKWILPGVNERPTGGTYYMHFLGIVWDPKISNQITTKLAFTLPFFTQELERSFVLARTPSKECFNLEVESLPSDSSLIERVTGGFKLCGIPKQKQRAWGYVRGAAVFRSWFIYEAISDRVLKKEAGERILKIIENYQTEENRRRK